MKKRSLHITPSNKNTGLGIVLYCNKCKRNITKDICEETGKSLKQCPFPDKHIYKVYVHVPGTANQRKTKNLKAKNYVDALKEGLEFRDEVINGIAPVKEIMPEIVKKEISRETPQLLKYALARYIGWLNNEGVPAHLIKERSPEHIKDIERALKCLAECLKENGYNLSSFTVEDIDNDVVGKVFSYLEKRKFANRTFNKYFSYYTSFLKWFAEEYNYPTRNYFEKVKRKNLNPKPEAITFSEYEALLKIIKPETGIKEYEDGVKPIRNLYRPWLADGIRLALETGRRREEIINLKWNNIQVNDGIRCIKVEDYKVNRIQNRISEEEKKFIYIPVTESLGKLLDELGYKKYVNTDNYILAPNIKISRGRIMSDVLSRGFTHYYDKLHTGRKLTFKCLRKTYITNLEIFMGAGNTKAITGHSDDQVIEKNYIDKKEMAKAARGFSVFNTESDRADELNEIRIEKNNINKQFKKEV